MRMRTKFDTRCAETGVYISKGEWVLILNGRAYTPKSKKYKEYLEAIDTANMITENENAYFDNFCANNNI